MNARLAAAALALTLLGGRARAASYDAYSEAVTGSARHVGLGGAVVAYPDGYATTFINPAGLAGLNGTGIDFGSDANTVKNFVVDLDNPGSRSLDLPLRYSYAGARYIDRKGWGLGFVLQTPFAVDDTFLDQSNVRQVPAATPQPFNNTTRVRAEVRTYTLAAAKTLLKDQLAVGVALNATRGSESFDYRTVTSSTDGIKESSAGDAVTADLGLLGRPWRWLQLGFVYKMGYRVGINRGPNLNLPPGVTWFRDVKVPDRMIFGAAWLPHWRLRVLFQGTYASALKDTILVGSGLFPQGNPKVNDGLRDTITWHWGTEYIPFKKSDLCVKLWGGGYYEDTGAQGGFTRYHNTAGFQYSPWFLDFSLAVDKADLYDNFTVGLGVDVLNLADRIARKYKWKIPDAVR